MAVAVVRKRSQTIDLLRGLSILAVVICHYFSLPNSPFRIGDGVPALPPIAWLGVDVFFVISGYLLGGQLLDGKMNTVTFYLRRASRILPLYCLLLVLVWVKLTPLEKITSLTFTQNFVYAATNPLWGYWIGPTWSLAIEEQFYLLLPLVIFLTPRNRLPTALWIIVGIAFGFRALATRDQGFSFCPDAWIRWRSVFCWRGASDLQT